MSAADKQTNGRLREIQEEQTSIATLSSQIPDDKATIVFIGTIGSGKSSTISSFHSWYKRRISTLAIPGGGQISVTNKMSGTPILDKKVMLYDTPGLRNLSDDENQQTATGTVAEIKRFVEKDDQMKFCVVYVLDESVEITREEINRMNELYTFFQRKENVQMVAMLTKIDKTSASAKTVEEMVGSLEVSEKVQQVCQNVPLPENCIFRMYNYHKQMDTDKELDMLIGFTFCRLLEKLLDIYERQERTQA